MPGKFSADVRAWTQKAKDNAEYVLRGSVSDLGELMSRRQASVKETGGSFQVGFVPVDTGELINSQEVSLNGSVLHAANPGSPPDYTAVVAGMELGDTLQAVFTAKHARPMEYGVTGKFGGRFFVRGAVQQWQNIVDANAALFED